MSNEITIFNAMNEGVQSYCSVPATSPEAATMIFNAMNNADEGVSDMINQNIVVSGLFVQKAMMADENTGEAKEAPKIVIFDNEGTTYATISQGMYNAFCNVCSLIGSPESWVSPIVIKILQKKVKKGSMLTFEVVDWGKNISLSPAE